MPKKAKPGAAYYEGGHRIMLGGVPCRIENRPGAAGLALMRQSASRFTRLHIPDTARWLREQASNYKDAEKLGNRSIADVVGCIERPQSLPLAA